jgi:cellulose synthase/poly-beta-1,6-N-acetylglucosamine synthase-like glycosyltransferase
VQQPVRSGKYMAIKKAMELVDTPIVVFSDANSMLNREALRQIVPHFANQDVGAVAGEKKILYEQQHSAVGQAEGWYWKYESFMKRLDSGLYSVVGAAGELFSIRTSLFEPINDAVILDDLVISMQASLKGYRIIYEPGAYATELPSISLSEEEKRKTRIAAGAFQSIFLLSRALNPFFKPVLFFQFLSRRIFRWVLGPMAMILLLISNIYLVYAQGVKGNYQIFLFVQGTLYLMAFCGFLLIRKGRQAGIFNIPFYFVFMNYCMIKGFFRNLENLQEVNWEKVKRQSVPL